MWSIETKERLVCGVSINKKKIMELLHRTLINQIFGVVNVMFCCVIIKITEHVLKNFILLMKNE
jgi:hypothetical protein